MTFDGFIVPDRGYATRGQLIDSGYRDSDIRGAVRAGLLVRIRHGVYVRASDHARLTPEQRHAVLARSVADYIGPGVALSHQSACASHGLAMFGHDLDRVHVTRLDGSAGRNEHGIAHHVGQVVPDDDLMEVDGMLVMKPARSIFEASTIGSVESAIVVMDSGLHLALTTSDELAELGGRMWNWQGARSAKYALTLADGRAESTGESRSRYLFRRENLPTPDLQVPVFDRDGRLIGYTDFAWLEHRHLGEFDGFLKYGSIPGDPRTPQQIVFDEKKREDAMRGQLLGMSRWTWVDLDPPRAAGTAARVRLELERSRRLYTRDRVIIPLS
ncbi:MAG: hypothetical protein JWP31_949 [Aeromicrobium sp.]|nr:hypothetical protein [Aeromicrobium sp.]